MAQSAAPMDVDTVVEAVAGLSIQEDEKAPSSFIGDLLWRAAISVPENTKPLLCELEHDLFQSILASCIRFVYKDDTMKIRRSILSPRLVSKTDMFHEFRMDPTTPETTRRRFSGAHVAIASLLAYGRGVNIAVVTSGQGAATNWFKQISAKFSNIPIKSRVLFRTRTFIRVLHPDVASDITTDQIFEERPFNCVRTFAATDGTIGDLKAFNVLILDDPKHLPQTVFQELILPLALTGKVVVISLGDFSNFPTPPN